MYAAQSPEKANPALPSAGGEAAAPQNAPHSLPGRALFALGSLLMRAGRSLQQTACQEPDPGSPPTYTITL